MATKAPAKKQTAGQKAAAAQKSVNTLQQQEQAAAALASGQSKVNDYTPINQLTPKGNPGAYGIDDPNAMIYTGDGTPSIKPGSVNQLLGAIADHYGIQHSNKISLQDQVLAALGAHLNIRPKKGQSVLTLAMQKLGINPLLANPMGSGVWGAVAQKLGVPIANNVPGSPQSKKITEVAGSIQLLNRTDLTNLQNLLYEGGFYGQPFVNGTQGSGKNSYTAGQLDPATMNAWGQLLDSTAKANKSGLNVTWHDYLTDAVSGTGDISTLFGTGADTSAVQKPQVTLATSDQLNNPAISQFEQLLGRMPSQSEIAELTKQFDAQQQTHADASNSDSPFETDASGVDVVPGVPSETDAAANFARNSNPVGYLAHGMANAGGLISNAIASGINGVSNDAGAATS